MLAGWLILQKSDDVRSGSDSSDSLDWREQRNSQMNRIILFVLAQRFTYVTSMLDNLEAIFRFKKKHSKTKNCVFTEFGPSPSRKFFVEPPR